MGDSSRSELDKLREDVRALLLSSKEGLTEKELKAEYFRIIGKQLPYAKLGFRSTADFLVSLSDSIEPRMATSEYGYLNIYFAKTDPNTKDLANLV